jgi:CheY-like chemotaxis protein
MSVGQTGVMRSTAVDRPTILLIEHERTVWRLLADALQEEGFTVVEAGDLGEAVRQARACEPDLIVIDLPQATLECVLDRMRSDPGTRGCPIIVVRRAGARPGSGRSESVDLNVLLEHVWRVVNTRVLGAIKPRGQQSG